MLIIRSQDSALSLEGRELSMHTAFEGIAESKFYETKLSVCVYYVFVFACLRISIIPCLFDNILLAINVDVLHPRIRENTKRIVSTCLSVVIMAIVFIRVLFVLTFICKGCDSPYMKMYYVYIVSVKKF